MNEKILEKILDELKSLNSGGGGGFAKSRASSMDDSSEKKGRSMNFIAESLDRSLKSRQDYLDITRKIAEEEKKIVKLKVENNESETISDRLAKNILKLEKLRTLRVSRDRRDALNKEKKALIDENKALLDQEKIQARILELKQDELDIQNEFNKENKKKIKLSKIIEKSTKLANDVSKSKTFLKSKDLVTENLSSLFGFSRGFFGFLQKSISVVLEQDAAMSKLSANYAMTRKESGMLKVNLASAARSTALIGVDSAQLAKTQAAYTDDLGRSVMLNNDALIAMAEMGVATSLGAEGAAKMAAEMELFGYSAVSTAKQVEVLMRKSRRSGMSSSVMAKKLQENLKLANTYTFKGGIEGVREMTMFSSKLRINMQSIASLADKISSPEGAIQTAASLQVLGGAFAGLSDPLSLLNQGINDMEGLTKTYEKMLDGVARIDKATGEVTIGGYDRLRLKAAAEAMGIGLDEMMTTVRTKAKREAMQVEIGLNASLKGNDEAIDMVASLAQFNQKNKKFEVSVGGRAIPIAELSKSNIESLQPKDDSLNLRTVAENTLGLRETFEAGMNSIYQSITKEIIPAITELTTIVARMFGRLSKSISGEGEKGPLRAIGKMGVKSMAKGSNKYATKKLMKVIGKETALMAGKQIPVIGTLFDLAAAGLDLAEGDFKGAGLNVASGVAGMADLLVPGLGTGLSTGIDAYNVARELGAFDRAEDVLIPSNGRPIKLNSKDDVLAAKPNGAVMKALMPSDDVSKTFSGISPSNSGVYSGRSSVGGNFDLKIQGSINLNGGGSTTKIDISELIKNKNFVRELSRLISSQMNIDSNGGKYSGGLNNNSFS